MSDVEKEAEEYAKNNQCCIPIHDKANIAEIRFEKIRDAYLAGHAAGYRSALKWVRSTLEGYDRTSLPVRDYASTLDNAIEAKLTERSEGQALAGVCERSERTSGSEVKK